MTDSASTARYRFWLAFMCLVLAGGFGTLAFGALTVGHGFAEDAPPMDAASILLAFKLTAAAFMGLIGACFWLAYRIALSLGSK